MKNLISLIFLILLISSCGKKTNDSSSDVITTTPELNTDEQENLSEVNNNNFSITLEKTEFDKDEVIIIEIKNTGNKSLNHLGFSFAGMPSLVTVTRLNCYEEIKVGDSCTFAAVYKNATGGYHKVKVVYDDFGDQKELEINVFLKGNQSSGDTAYLYADTHTFSDCSATKMKQKFGTIATKHYDDFCAFRGENWNATEKTEITTDPISVFNSHADDANEYYCPIGWSLQSFQFESTIVVEHASFFGGKKDVIIPAGESRELCTSRNIFGCKEKKVFYSRLTKVYCY
jgi:hypothetical protein